jgi:hypothetical protein
MKRWDQGFRPCPKRPAAQTADGFPGNGFRILPRLNMTPGVLNIVVVLSVDDDDDDDVDYARKPALIGPYNASLYPNSTVIASTP